jgi:hypothetical protein
VVQPRKRQFAPVRAWLFYYYSVLLRYCCLDLDRPKWVVLHGNGSGVRRSPLPKPGLRPCFSAMCRAAAGHEPACPCRFVAITTSSQSPSPSPWSPRAHGDSAVPDPRLFGVHRGRTGGPRPCAAARGRSCCWGFYVRQT